MGIRAAGLYQDAWMQGGEDEQDSSLKSGTRFHNREGNDVLTPAVLSAPAPAMSCKRACPGQKTLI